MGSKQSLPTTMNMEDYKREEYSSLEIPEDVSYLHQIETTTETYTDLSLEVTWKIFDKNLKQYFVLKKLRITEKNTKAFHREIYILTRLLKHPGIIWVLRYFKSENYYFIIYNYFPGKPVLEYFVENPKKLTTTKIKQVAVQMLRVIQYMWRQGVIHRKINQKYVIFDGEQIVLSGFGDAALFDLTLLWSNEEKLQDFTQDNIHFCSLEMLQQKYDQQVDLWALGVLIYLLVTGKPLFPASNKNELMEKL